MHNNASFRARLAPSSIRHAFCFMKRSYVRTILPSAIQSALEELRAAGLGLEQLIAAMAKSCARTAAGSSERCPDRSRGAPLKSLIVAQGRLSKLLNPVNLRLRPLPTQRM